MEKLDPVEIGFTAEAMAVQIRCGGSLACVSQCYGCAVAEALGYDPYGAEACSLADIASVVLGDLRCEDADSAKIVSACIAKSGSLNLSAKSSRKRLFESALDSGTMHRAGLWPSIWNKVRGLFAALGDGLASVARYPSMRGISRRFLAGVIAGGFRNRKGRS